MSTYMLPSSLDSFGGLWYPSGFFLATRQRFDTDWPGRVLWVIVPPFPFIFGCLQCVNKCCFIIAGPNGKHFIFGACILDVCPLGKDM
jgi:hypothetical protein